METNTKKRFPLKRVIGIAIIVIAVLVALTDFITDILWFNELGYVSVFLTKLFTQLKIGIPVFVAVSFVAYIYFKVLKQNYCNTIESNAKDRSKTINIVTWVMALAYGAVTAGIIVTRLWYSSLIATNSTDFGITEEVFGKDASFYVMELDFLANLINIIIGLVIALLIITLIYYSILMALRRPKILNSAEERASGADFGEDAFGNSINRAEDVRGFFDKDNMKRLLGIGKKQLMSVGVVLFIAVAVKMFFAQYELLYNHTGAVYGAGFTDVHITLWVYRILMILAVCGAISVVIALNKKVFKLLIRTILLMVAVGVVGFVAATIVQNFVVSPDEINKESVYLERNIKMTQYAYNLENVTTKSFKASSGLTAADIANNQETISNIRINDYKPTRTFYNQTQAIRQYYSFNDVDVDRYTINGLLTQTFLSSRELNEENIADTWLNLHMKYTHGYGITVSQVDQITSSGQPDVIVGDIPTETKEKVLEVTQPEIYFGELTDDYILVNTDEKEFDYPDGDDNKYTTYEGSAGIKLNPINRLLFAIREHSLKLLVSSNINSDSKIIINRNILDRLNKIMPYLSYEDDPYMCVVNGKLFWIVDAYTSTSRFPYSEPYSETGTNYIRNSVKVVVNAYTGKTTYYIIDQDDAIAKTMQKIYPTLFKDYKEMPEGLKKHVRYPDTMFNIQASVYGRYHMNNVNVFYQDEDHWDIANEIYGTDEQAMSSSYYVLNLPGEKNAEFVNSIPYTPKNKKNLTGLFVARNDGKHYGELILYKLPKSKVVYGPMQVEAQIDQNTEISKEFSLWSQAGSTYSRGNMFVIPIEDSLLYVEPVYLEATNSSIPEVKRVIVAYGDKIAYESTLSAALESLFGDGATSSSTSSSSSSSSSKLTKSQIIKKAQQAYDDAIAAQKSGNWAEYGKQMDKLESYLNKLN